MNAQFQSVFTIEDLTIFPEKGPNPYPSILDITITSNGIAQLLSGLDVYKAPGPDNIGPLVLKELYDITAPILETIFNAFLKNHVVPQDWKLANVTPIFKKEDCNQPCNYRPILLTCIISKVSEHIIASNIMKYFESNGILYRLQHGF